MTDTTNGGAGQAMPSQSTAGQPQLTCLAQYIKDFSFENPNAPRSLGAQQAQPSINVQINVNATPLSDTDIEVVIGLEGKAEAPSLVLYSFELAYAGVFRLQNIPQENAQQVVMVDCPHLLFPFAREIIASAVSGSSFPPLLLGPINFFALFEQKVAELGGQPPSPAAN